MPTCRGSAGKRADELHLAPPVAFAGFGISPATVRSWARRGRLDPAGVGPAGHVLYSVAAVLQLAAVDVAVTGRR